MHRTLRLQIVETMRGIDPKTIVPGREMDKITWENYMNGSGEAWSDMCDRMSGDKGDTFNLYIFLLQCAGGRSGECALDYPFMRVCVCVCVRVNKQ